jgi:hypothetical protein
VPRVHDWDIESLEVARISRGKCRTTRLRDAGDERIAQVDDAAGPLAIGSDVAASPRPSHRA